MSLHWDFNQSNGFSQMYQASDALQNTFSSEAANRD